MPLETVANGVSNLLPGGFFVYDHADNGAWFFSNKVARGANFGVDIMNDLTLLGLAVGCNVGLEVVVDNGVEADISRVVFVQYAAPEDDIAFRGNYERTGFCHGLNLGWHEERVHTVAVVSALWLVIQHVGQERGRRRRVLVMRICAWVLYESYQLEMRAAPLLL